MLLDGPVSYIDPFFGRFHQLVPEFCKHFRFGYQKEYRLIWLPSDSSSIEAPKATHVYFDLGPLTGCSEIIWL